MDRSRGFSAGFDVWGGVPAFCSGVEVLLRWGLCG